MSTRRPMSRDHQHRQMLQRIHRESELKRARRRQGRFFFTYTGWFWTAYFAGATAGLLSYLSIGSPWVSVALASYALVAFLIASKG